MVSFFVRATLLTANWLTRMLPSSYFYGIKRTLYRLGGCEIGKDVKFNSNVNIVYKNIEIGSGSWIGRDVLLYSSSQGRISIGRNNDFAPGVLLNTGTHLIGDKSRRAGKPIASDILIGNGCWIGMGAIILSGTKVGDGCVIAAGAVVKGEFPENVLIAGVPAVIKRIL